MAESASASPVLVPSSLFNLQVVLEDLLGPGQAALLGVCWVFNPFDPGRPAIAEFDLPMPWRHLATPLARFSGVLLEHFTDDPANDAYDRVELGQPVIVAVDSHDLPYRPAYGRVHSARTVIVTGIDRAAGAAEIRDVWMPHYAGPVALADLERARASCVPHEPSREPLFAGCPLHRGWWTLALSSNAPIATPDGSADAVEALAGEAGGGAGRSSTSDMIDRFREAAVAALESRNQQSIALRRAAALHVRAEIGLRAYLLGFLSHAARLLHEPLLAAEVDVWSGHIRALACARDVLIKSVVFDRPEYGEIVDRALGEASTLERRFLRFLADFCGDKQLLAFGRVSC
jgi:hypothetical protein